MASRACDGCGACVRQCPVGALRLVDGRPFWTWRCESCMRCMNQCPRRAVETAHGFVVGLVWGLSALLTAVVYPALRSLSGAGLWLGPAAGAVRSVLESALTLAVLFAAYRLLHRALRLRWVERVVVATSLTHFRFWRRYRPRRALDGGATSPEASAGRPPPPRVR